MTRRAKLTWSRYRWAGETVRIARYQSGERFAEVRSFGRKWTAREQWCERGTRSGEFRTMRAAVEAVESWVRQ